MEFSHLMDPQYQVACLIQQSLELLGSAACKEILHWQHHDEFERAFEALVLELAEIQAKPPEFDRKEWATLAESLGLWTDSVLVGDFRKVFDRWAAQQ